MVLAHQLIVRSCDLRLEQSDAMAAFTLYTRHRRAVGAWVPWHPQILIDQLTYPNRGQIMTTTLLHAPIVSPIIEIHYPFIHLFVLCAITIPQHSYKTNAA